MVQMTTTVQDNLRAFPACDIATALSPDLLTVPCEPLNDWLAITPSVYAGEPNEVPVFTGGFQITHRPTGRSIGTEPACINCAREVGRRLAALDIAWDEQGDDEEANKAWLARQTDEVRQAITDGRDLGWYCDAKPCRDGAW